MNKKQSMKHLMIFAAVTIICGTMALTSCSEGDNALVVTDEKPWTISTDDMDPNVRPGDDFFMHCNGGYWQSTHVREDTAMIVSFLRTDVLNDLRNKLADLSLPSLEVLKSHEAQPRPTKEEMEAYVTQKLQPLKEASTLEEAWRTTGQLVAEGLLFNFNHVIMNYHTVLTSIMFPREMNLPLPDINVFNERINSPGFPNMLMPLVGSPTTHGGESQQWPMLVAWCEGSGINPEHVMTWKAQVMATTPEAVVMPHIQQWDDELLALQAMDLESYKQAACEIFLKMTVKEMEGIAGKTAEDIYNTYCTYEKNRAFALREEPRLCRALRDTRHDRARQDDVRGTEADLRRPTQPLHMAQRTIESQCFGETPSHGVLYRPT